MMKLKDAEIATYIPNRLCTERDLDWSIQNRWLKQQKSQTWLELYGVRIVQFHIINGPDAQNLMDLLHLLIFIAVVEKGGER